MFDFICAKVLGIQIYIYYLTKLTCKLSMRETFKRCDAELGFAVFVLSFIVYFVGGGGGWGFLFLISEFAVNLSAFNCLLFFTSVRS